MTNVVPLDQARYERNPPVNLDIENEVLGALLMAPAAVAQVESILRPEHFSEPLHGLVYEAILDIMASEGTPTAGQLYQRLGRKVSETAVAGPTTVREYLAQLARIGGMTGHSLITHARMVRDLWALRQVVAAADDIGRREGYRPSDLLEETFAALDEVRASLLDRETRSVLSSRAADDLVGRIEAALRGERRTLPRTGIERLDDALGGGLQPATLVVAAARTSMGKSILGVEIADRVAHQGYGVVYHSLEMSRQQVAARQMSSRLERKGVRLPYEAIMRADGLTAEQGERVAHAARDLRGESLMIEDGGGVTIHQIAATAERRVNAFERKGVKRGVVVIDHAHQVEASRRHDKDEGKIREVSAGALALAKRLEMPVILLAQLNRQTEAREDKRPGPSDLRGSGALEEDCDALIFPYRAAYYVERSAQYRSGDPAALDEYEAVKHSLELIVDKNRAGRSNQVIHAWIDPALNAIRNGVERYRS